MIKWYRNLYWFILFCTLSQTLFMYDVHINGVNVIWLLFIQYFLILLGISGILTMIIIGAKFINMPADHILKKDWNKIELIKYISIPFIIIYNVWITDYWSR
jgi:hypothetical protein